MRSTALLKTLLLFGFLALFAPAQAQQSDSPDEDSSAGETETNESQPSDEGNQDDGDSDAKNAADEALRTWDRLIYIPFQELQKVLDGQEASAVIPYQEYLELLRHFLNKDQSTSAAPDAIVTKSDYQATVEKDVVRIQASLQVRVLKKDGWARLPMQFGSASVGKLDVADDSGILLNGRGNGAYELLIDSKSGPQHTVTLELLTPVRTSPESRSFAIQCPSVAISELQLTLPEADQSVQILPLQILLPVEGNDEDAASDQTIVKASLGATDRFEVKWNPEAGAKPVMDLLTSVSNQTNVRIEPGLLQTTSVLNYEVLRGELTSVEVHLPLDARVIDVSSGNGRIGNWKPEAVGETHQKLQIDLLTPVRDQFQLVVQTERTLEDNTVQVIGTADGGRLAGVHAAGVVRESGQVTVGTDAALTTVVQNKSGVQRIEAAANGGKSAGSGQTWKFSGRTGALVLSVKPVEPRLLVQQNARVVFENDRLRLTTRLTYTVERAGVFQLEVEVPEGLTIDSVRADGMTEFNTDEQSGRLTLSLAQQRQGTIHVDITAHAAFDASVQNDQVAIPTIRPLKVEREDGHIYLYAPRSLNVSTVDEETKGVFPAEPAGERAIGRAIQVASWEYSQRPIQLTVKTSVRPVQLAASVATTATIEPKRMDVRSLLNFVIANAGIDTLRVAVPESVADRVTFRAVNAAHRIQQSNRAAADEDGWVTWTLVLQDEVTGTVAIEANWVTPLDDQDDQASRSVKLDPVRVLPPYADDEAEKRKVSLSQPKGEIRLLRHESLSISATAEGDTMQQIDVRELQLLPQDGFIAFRYFAQPVSATIELMKHEIHQVVETVVSRAAVEVATDYQSLASLRARFRMTTSERQRLRVDVPAGSDLQSPLLNDQRTTFEAASDVEAAEGWEAYYVNITREGAVDQDFLLTLQLRVPIAEADSLPYDRRGGKQILRLPAIGDASGGTVVQETRVAVWGPEEIAFVGEPTGWSIVGNYRWNFWNPLVSPTAIGEAKDLGDWVGDSGTTSEFASQGNTTVYRSLGRRVQVNVVWWNRTFLVAVISVALLFVGFILRHTSWENRLTLVILGIVAVAVWSLQDDSEVLQFVSAGSLALLGVAAIWIVSAFTGSGRDQSAANKPDDDNTPDAPDAERQNPDDGGTGSAKSPPTTTSTAAPATAESTSAPERPRSMETGSATAAGSLPPGAISPSPGVSQWMDDIMKGRA